MGSPGCLETGGAVLGVFECALVFCGETYDQKVSEMRVKKGIVVIGPSRQMHGG
jgi:hypothetical protein